MKRWSVDYLLQYRHRIFILLRMESSLNQSTNQHHDLLIHLQFIDAVCRSILRISPTLGTGTIFYHFYPFPKFHTLSDFPEFLHLSEVQSTFTTYRPSIQWWAIDGLRRSPFCIIFQLPSVFFLTSFLQKKYKHMLNLIQEGSRHTKNVSKKAPWNHDTSTPWT